MSLKNQQVSSLSPPPNKQTNKERKEVHEIEGYGLLHHKLGMLDNERRDFQVPFLHFLEVLDEHHVMGPSTKPMFLGYFKEMLVRTSKVA